MNEIPDPVSPQDLPGQTIPDVNRNPEDMAARQTLSGELRGLVDDFQKVIETEIDFHMARLSFTVSETKHISVLMVGVGVFGSVAVMALVLGLLIALIPIYGPWIAIAIVTLACLAIAALCFFLATWKMRRIQSLFRGGKEED